MSRLSDLPTKQDDGLHAGLFHLHRQVRPLRPKMAARTLGTLVHRRLDLGSVPLVKKSGADQRQTCGGEDDKVGQHEQGAPSLLDTKHDQQRVQREVHLHDYAERRQEQKERVSVHQHAEHAQWHHANQIVEEPGTQAR